MNLPRGRLLVALGVLWSWRSKWHAGEMVAGALVGGALLMKLVPVILLPLVALIVWIRNRQLEETGSDGGRKMGMMAPTDVGGYRDGFGQSVRALLVFSLSMVIVFVVVDCLI